MGGMLHPALVLISEEYKVSLDQVNAWTIAQTTVWTSVFAFFTAAGANIIGKRPFLLGALVLLLISNVWGAMASVCDNGPRAQVWTLMLIPRPSSEFRVTGLRARAPGHRYSAVRDHDQRHGD